MPSTRQSTVRRQSAAWKQKEKERKERKAKNEQFRRRNRSSVRKGVGLVKLCGAKWYQVVERDGRIWETNSEDPDGPWPASRLELVSDFQLPLSHVIPTRTMAEKQ